MEIKFNLTQLSLIMTQGYLALPIAERHGTRRNFGAKMWKHSSYEITKVRRTFTRTTIEENGTSYSISFNRAVQDQD